MRNLTQRLRGRYLFPALTLAWILAWALPWVLWIESFPWIRLGISVLILIIPGFMLSLLLVGRRLTIPAHITSGLAISIFTVGLFGLLGRKFHLPFTFIKITFMLFGLVCLLLSTRFSLSGKQFYKQKKNSITTVVILLFTMIIGFAITLKGGLELDDFSYMGYLTTWQHSQALDFKDVFFGLDDVGQIRFWLAMLPMSQALLSEISGIHGLLLIGYYLEPVLVVLAILAAYNLYDGFLHAKERAALALLLHFTILLLSEPGDLFFHHLTQDKAFAAFILAPTFFLAARCFLGSFTLRCSIYFLLIGFSLTLTHPIMLAYSVFTIALYTIIVTRMAKDNKKLGVVLALLVVIIFPVGLLRFISIPWVSRYIFGLETTLQQPGSFDFESASNSRDVQELVSNIEGTPFYGFNPHRIQFVPPTGVETGLWIFISWTYLYILILGLVWSLFNLKRNNVAPFIFAVSLPILLALIPYTGWLMGYFVSARMLWRAPWLYPVGLTTAVLAVELFKVIEHRMLASRKSKVHIEFVGRILISLLCLKLFLGHPVIKSDGKMSLLPHRENYTARLADLSNLGDYLEVNVEKPSIFLAPQDLMYYLPGLSSKAKVVFFRAERFNLRPIDEQQLESVFSNNKRTSMAQRMEILVEHNVQYILVKDDYLRAFYSEDPHFTNITNVGNFGVFEFSETTP